MVISIFNLIFIKNYILFYCIYSYFFFVRTNFRFYKLKHTGQDYKIIQNAKKKTYTPVLEDIGCILQCVAHRKTATDNIQMSSTTRKPVTIGTTLFPIPF